MTIMVILIGFLSLQIAVFKLNNLPEWLNLSLGYGANGMLGEFENKKYYKGQSLPDYKRYKQFYISLDIDFL